MLSQSVGYAAAALGYVAAAGGKALLVKEMAEACDIPAAYLAKIINALARKQVVLTQRGVGGGVTLARPAEKITLYELCEALDDPIVLRRCMLGTAQCSDDRACPAHEFWTAHRGRQLAFLQETTVADIAAFETRKRWKRPGSSADATGPTDAKGAGGARLPLAPASARSGPRRPGTPPPRPDAGN
ncbi:MAG: Rrf2 family transcriptional regulator [Phycisphaerales bacterium]|nr:Rrf2 family transcriptional regulator [Phycisphaerales bacterium]